MRVGLFTNNYLPFRGGVTAAVETLREGLTALGHGVWVFAPGPRHPEDDPAVVLRYPSIPAPTYPGFSLAVPLSPRLGRRAREIGLDIVHAQHPFLLGPAARRLARQSGIPLVFTYHTRYEKYAHYVPLPERVVAALAVRLSRRFAASADLVVAPSAHIAETLRARGVHTRVAVIPTGVPVERFRPGDRSAARRELGWPDGGPVCLYVGRLDREKSVGRLIAAFEIIAGALPDAWLVLVGHGSYEAPLRACAARSPVAGRIRFHGGVAREALPPLYRAADLFVFASETETQGLVLAEAHACGLPAVAVRASGVEEVVRDGETGLLTKGLPGDLAEAAITLLLDGGWRGAMARAARQVAESSFSAARQVDAVVAEYGRLVGADRRGGRGGGRGGGAMTPEPRRDLRVVFHPDWDPGAGDPGRRGLFAGDPRVRTLVRVLVSYPEVRYVLPDRVCLDAAVNARVMDTLGRFLGRQAWLVKSVIAH